MPDLKFTLGFLLKDDRVLMLHRRFPPNADRWNGVGGRIEPGESPFACLIREVREETGLVLGAARLGGTVTWAGSDEGEGGMYVYLAEAPAGAPRAGREGPLAWKRIDWVLTSGEAVENIPDFLPPMLRGEGPKEYHFDYEGDEIVERSVRPLPEAIRDHFTARGSETVRGNGKDALSGLARRTTGN